MFAIEDEHQLSGCVLFLTRKQNTFLATQFHAIDSRGKNKHNKTKQEAGGRKEKQPRKRKEKAKGERVMMILIDEGNDEG